MAQNDISIALLHSVQLFDGFIKRGDSIEIWFR